MKPEIHPLLQSNNGSLSVDQLRRVADYLYDGEMATFPILRAIRAQYRRSDRILLWLCRNELRGTKLVEFFQNESGDIDGGGLLSGITYILNHIDGTPNATGRLKANELL